MLKKVIGFFLLANMLLTIAQAMNASAIPLSNDYIPEFFQDPSAQNTHPAIEDPILSTTLNSPVVNAITHIKILNNGFYLGTAFSSNAGVNSINSIGVPVQAYNDSTSVMNVPVNLMDNSDPGGRIYVGYHLNDYFSLEERYTRFPLGNVHEMTSFEYDNYMKIPKNNTYEMVARQSLPLGHGFSLLSKEGKVLVSTDLVENSNLADNNLEQDHHKFLRSVLGLGSDYYFSRSLSGDLYYTRILNTPSIHPQLISMGLTYHAH